MRFIDEYRDGEAAKKTAEMIRRVPTRPWTVMEIWRRSEHITIVKYGIESLLRTR